MKKIGFVDYYLSEWHANNYPRWVKELSDGYEVAYAYAELDVSPKDGVTTDKWCQKMGVERCFGIDELCKKSDFIMILAPDDADTHLRYAQAVLPYGKPTYIDKTFAPDLDTAKAIFDISDTPFFSTSALRYATELDEFKNARDFVITGGGPELDIYAVHIAEMAVVLLGEPIECAKTERIGALTVCSAKSISGKTATLVYSPGMDFSVTAECADGKRRERTVKSEFFKALIADVLKFFDSGRVPFDPAQTLEVMRLRDNMLK